MKWGRTPGASSVQAIINRARDWTSRHPLARGMVPFMIFSACMSWGGWEQALAQNPPGTAKSGRILVTLDWAEVPLRERLTEFGKKYGVAVFLDRRVDPDQKIELSVRDQPVEGVLA